MDKALIIEAGSLRFCVDMTFVDSIHMDGRSIEGAAVFSLPRLIHPADNLAAENQQFVVLKDKDIFQQLFVSNIGAIFDLTPEAVLQIPRAFSLACRKYFPMVVMMEDDVVPVITPESIMALGRRGDNEAE